jgi:2'-5' RNA ligase
VRVFAAAWPDDATRAALAELEDRLAPGRGMRPVGAAQWHVTLRFLGSLPAADAERDGDPPPGAPRALVAALRAACGGVPGPLHCRLGPRTAWFSGVRVLHLPAAGLDDLAATVHAATSAAVPPRDGEQPFNGHLTLARAKGRRPGAATLARLAGAPFEATFPVDHVDLVASEPTPRGHRYHTLDRIALGGGPFTLPGSGTP